MVITDLQVAMLRALLECDFDTHDRLIEHLDRAEQDGYALLMGAA